MISDFKQITARDIGQDLHTSLQNVLAISIKNTVGDITTYDSHAQFYFHAGIQVLPQLRIAVKIAVNM